MATLALVVGGYTLAGFMHLSAPLAMVLAGMLIGNHGRRLAMSDITREHLDTLLGTGGHHFKRHPFRADRPGSPGAVPEHELLTGRGPGRAHHPPGPPDQRGRAGDDHETVQDVFTRKRSAF